MLQDLRGMIRESCFKRLALLDYENVKLIMHMKNKNVSATLASIDSYLYRLCMDYIFSLNFFIELNLIF